MINKNLSWNVLGWLDNEPLTYDFVEDTQEEYNYHEYPCIPKGFLRYFVYRADGYDVEHNSFLKPEYLNRIKEKIRLAGLFKVKDPDSASGLLKEIYAVLWPRKGVGGYSDTMTSAQTLVNVAVDNVRYNIDWKLYQDESARPCTKNVFIALMAAEDRLSCVLNRFYPCLRNYISVYHSIGNYCPVPKGFNRARGQKGYDFWDLTLEKIREFYLEEDEEKQKEIMRRLLHSKISEQDLDSCIFWFWYSGGNGEKGEAAWRYYIEKFFMQDYVNPETYEVIPLWHQHKWDNAISSLKSMNNGDIELAAAEITNRIMKRGQRMIDAVRHWRFYYDEEDDDSLLLDTGERVDYD